MRVSEMKGRKEGRAEGEAKGRAEIAKAMKARGYADNDIIQLTGVSAEELSNY